MIDTPLLRKAVALATGLVLAAGLAAVAALPTGSPSIDGTVLTSARLAAVAPLGNVRYHVSKLGAKHLDTINPGT